jgi:Mn2+/Fe2+ NRAMP family transporter
MAAAEPDDETAMGTQVLVSEKSRVLSILGPGLITGASDDDPSGIATYSQVGAQFGFSISWTMLFSYPLMAAIQEISGRIGRTTGRGIAGKSLSRLVAERHRRSPLYREHD